MQPNTPCSFATSGTEERRPVFALTPFTMLDYPGKTACIVWLAGCNLRCAYCHNPEMIAARGQHPWQMVESFLKTRVGKLQGVVFSGGEATTCPELPEMCRAAKRLGFDVKLDTNGTRPQVVKALVEEGLIDFIALDYKAPPEVFHRVTGQNPARYHAFSETLDYLIGREFPFEVRTTVHTHLLSHDHVLAIHNDLATRGYKGVYHVQNYRHGPTLGDLPPQDAPLPTHQIPQGPVRVEFRNF